MNLYELCTVTIAAAFSLSNEQAAINVLCWVKAHQTTGNNCRFRQTLMKVLVAAASPLRYTWNHVICHVLNNKNSQKFDHCHAHLLMSMNREFSKADLGNVADYNQSIIIKSNKEWIY